MNSVKERIPLQVIEGQLVLNSVIECKKLRVPLQLMKFIIDTGSPSSYLSYLDVMRLQIAIKEKSSQGYVDFGGSRFQKISLPNFRMHLLKENQIDKFDLDLSISALKTTKVSEKKIKIAQVLPSILGLDFLSEQKFSLHVILTEKIAYLEYET